MDVLDADISINDEATANVAPENEADLMNAVEELTKEKTIIMIAHRLRRKIEIGERLRREREKAGYSQEAFTEILDCCAVTISRCW